MYFTTLIQAPELKALSGSPGALLVCDCGSDLADPGAGARAYAQAHIPGAVHLRLDHDLSGAKTGFNGRHPLPAREQVAALMARLGAGNGTQVVAYDAMGGMYAARLWWLLRWAGHERAAVLDGGLPAWLAQGYPVESQAPAPALPGSFSLRAPLAATLDYEQMLDNVNAAQPRPVIDARAADRFRGENETLDAVGGHLPGARNRYFKNNLASDDCFKPAAQLRAEFLALLRGAAPAQAINQCGSGVTACHNLLAMEVAGLPGAALYPGSWSEWSSREGSPIATGNDTDESIR